MGGQEDPGGQSGGNPKHPKLQKQQCKGLIRPSKGLIRRLKGLIRPLKSLIRPFKGLIWRFYKSGPGRFEKLEVLQIGSRAVRGRFEVLQIGSRAARDCPGPNL